MIKPLLTFDLDGTLIDSAADIADAVNLTLNNHDKPSVDFPTVVAHIGDGLRKLISDFFPEIPNNDPMHSVIEQEFFKTYESVMLNKTQVFPGVFEFLESWDGPIGIITNKNLHPTKILVEHLGLNRFQWVEVFGADSWPEKKPSPLPLQKMMALANRDHRQTFMIGDGTPDMLSAKNANTKSIAINFGYTKLEILKQYQPSAVLNHYSELAELIHSFRN